MWVEAKTTSWPRDPKRNHTFLMPRCSSPVPNRREMWGFRFGLAHGLQALPDGKRVLGPIWREGARGDVACCVEMVSWAIGKGDGVFVVGWRRGGLHSHRN